MLLAFILYFGWKNRTGISNLKIQLSDKHEIKRKTSFAGKQGVGTDEKFVDSLKRAKFLIITLFPLISPC